MSTVVWQRNFTGNATVNPGTTNQFERRFALRLILSGSTPGTVSYDLQIFPLSNNQASSFGSGTYSLNVGGTIATNARMTYDFRGGVQTPKSIASGTVTVSGNSVSTSGSAVGGVPIGSASNSTGSYSNIPVPPFFPFFPPFFPFFPPSFPFFPPPPAAWSTTSFTETARVGTAYNKTLIATGIRASSPYELVGGSTVIPLGLTLNANTGVISGTPTAGASQTFNFTVNAYNIDGIATVSPTFTLNRRQPAPSWTAAGADNTLGRPRVGTAYSDQVVAVNAAPTNAYSETGLAGTGLVLNPNTGAVTGTVTSTSTFSFTITAKNSDTETQTAQQSFTLTPSDRLPVWADQILTTTTVRVNQTYTDGVNATNAVGYALQTPNTLPPGLSLNTGTGAITGIPTTIGTYQFRVVARNATTPTAETITTGLLTIVVERSAGGAVWNGTTWVPSVFKVWNGADWIESPVKVWNGADWADPVN
jgi:hypothetical protein